MEQTLVLVKPDGVQRGLIGEIVTRFERRGLKLVGMKLMQMSSELASAHYTAHVERDFFPGLVTYITSGPIVAMVWEGKDAIQIVRRTMGATKAGEANPGTIRGDLAVEIHAHKFGVPRDRAVEMLRIAANPRLPMASKPFSAM